MKAWQQILLGCVIFIAINFIFKIYDLPFVAGKLFAWFGIAVIPALVMQLNDMGTEEKPGMFIFYLVLTAFMIITPSILFLIVIGLITKKFFI